MSPLRALRLHADLILAGIMTVLFQVQVWTSADFAGVRPGSALVALCFTATLALRRRMTIVPLAAGVALSLIAHATVGDLGNSPFFGVGLVICIYTAGNSGARTVRLAGLAAALALVPMAAWTDSGFSVLDAGWVALIIVGPWAAGRGIRLAQDRARLLERRNVTLEMEQESASARAVAEERVRIARELHDVVAHAISLIVVQSRGGRRVARRRPEEAIEAFDTIEHAGQQALGEMRRLLGMLRADDDELALAPQPSLGRLPELIRSVAAAGLEVELQVEGDACELPPGIDVSAYRIVQEALTNALRHAGVGTARLIVRYGSECLDIEVLDEGVGTGANDGSGNGLIGMRERVAVYGGELQAGARPEGGYALRARLPLAAGR